MTTFLFASVATSGLRVLAYTRFTRRDRFVLAAALSFGFGDLLVPDIFTHLFDGVNAGKGLQGLLNSITIILSTPCEHIITDCWSRTNDTFESLIRRDCSHNIESYTTTGGLVLGGRWSRQGRSRYRRRERYT